MPHHAIKCAGSPANAAVFAFWRLVGKLRFTTFDASATHRLLVGPKVFVDRGSRTPGRLHLGELPRARAEKPGEDAKCHRSPENQQGRKKSTTHGLVYYGGSRPQRLDSCEVPRERRAAASAG